MLKYSYEKTMVLGGRTYVFFKGNWWEENIVADYERCNDSAEETLKDMWLDTMYENCVWFESYHCSEHLVHYVML